MDSTITHQKPCVAIAHGKTREDAVRRALELVRGDVLAKLKGRVLVKPNFLSSVNRLAATQADAVRPVLELLRDAGAESVVIGEGATYSTAMAFRNFGYDSLRREFNVELLDLNRLPFDREVELVTRTGGVHTADYSGYTASCGTVISVAVAKTHDFSTVTLSLKNMMGSIKRIHRLKMHGYAVPPPLESLAERVWNGFDGSLTISRFISGMVFSAEHAGRYIQRKVHDGSMPGLESQVRALAENIVRLGRVLMPDVAVIDSFEAMEGEGPGRGTPVRMGIAVAGTSPVSCDAVMALMMGFDPLSIGYLSLADSYGLGVADPAKIDIAGEAPSNHTRLVKRHSNYSHQMRWREAW